MRFASVLATMLGRRKRADMADMLPLEAAAEMVMAEMHRRQLPLARVAGMGRSQAEAKLWIGDNMLHNAGVLGRSRATNTFEEIAGAERRSLHLLADWSGAAPAGSDTPVYETLSIAQPNVDAYLDWARSVA